MRKVLVFFSMMAIIGIMAVNLTSCGGDEDPIPEPTLTLQVDPDPTDGYIAIIAVNALNVASMAWDYDDGESSSTVGSHNHPYTESGTYTITVTATGDDGSIITKNADVTIVASIEEMLAGADDNGKIWVLTKADGAGKMGVGHVDNSLGLIQDVIPANILAAFGMESEYPDEFTFYKDGKFTIDTENGRGLASALYGGVQMQLGVTDVYMSPDVNQLPLSIVPMASVNDGTWALSYESFTTNAQNEVGIDAADQVMEQKIFSFTEDDTRVNLKLSTGAYVGFFDLSYPAIPAIGLNEAVDNSFYIIKSVTPDEINIAIASCGLGDIMIYPTYMLHLTYVPK